jgi:hypothetical protein
VERRALATDTHREAKPLGGGGQAGVHTAGVGVAAGHRGDRKRGAQAVAEEVAAKVDGRDIRPRQTVMYEPDIGPSGTRAARDLARCRQVEMFRLALRDGVAPHTRD